MKHNQKNQNSERRIVFSATNLDELDRNENYISIFTTSFHIPNNKAFEFNHDNFSNDRIISIENSRILGLLNEFRTVYEHAACIEDRQHTSFKQALLAIKHLWSSGLLISQTQYLDKLRERKSNDYLQPIDILAWITRDRTESISKSLESFIEGIKSNNRTADFIVFDDSTPQNFEKSKKCIATLKRRHHIDIKLVGEAERKSLVNQINAKLTNKVPRNVIEYGLHGLNSVRHRTGANRNAFLLFTIGKRSLLTDDDIFCKISKNGNDKRITFTSNPSGLRISSKVFVNQSELVETTKFDHNDPIELHQALLGQSINTLVERYKNCVDLNDVDPHFVHDSLTSEKKVRITMMGAAGDSGAGSPISKIFAPSDNLIPLISDISNFESKMKSRLVVQSYESYVIGRPNLLLGMNLGIDNTDLLPPFLPNGRNSDGIFSSILNKCFRNCFIGHLPFVISHVPPETRTVFTDELNSTSIRIPDVLRFSIDIFKNSAQTNEGGLKSLGIYIREISEQTNAGLARYFRIVDTQMKTNMLGSLQYLLNRHGEINKDWAKILEKRLTLVSEYLRNQNSLPQFNEIPHLQQDEQLAFLKNLFRNFGDLLFYWPEIYKTVAASKDMIEYSK
jgi:hypothetical protein